MQSLPVKYLLTGPLLIEAAARGGLRRHRVVRKGAGSVSPCFRWMRQSDQHVEVQMGFEQRCRFAPVKTPASARTSLTGTTLVSRRGSVLSARILLESV